MGHVIRRILYRSFTKKSDYFHIFDYWKWDEEVVENTLSLYDWEKAIDTNTTWRIGDGTVNIFIITSTIELLVLQSTTHSEATKLERVRCHERQHWS